MKSKMILASGLLTIMVSTVAFEPIKKEETIYENFEETRLEVVISEEGSEIPSALYQIMENGHSKVVDLVPISVEDPRESHAANLKTLYRAFQAMHLSMNEMEVTEVKSEDSCHLVYSFVHRTAE